jgi:hypothetical protein
MGMTGSTEGSPGGRPTGHRLAVIGGLLTSVAAIATAVAALAGVFGSSSARSSNPTPTAAAERSVAAYGRDAGRACATEVSALATYQATLRQGNLTGDFGAVATASQGLKQELAKLGLALDKIEPPTGREADAQGLVSAVEDATAAAQDVADAAASRDAQGIRQGEGRIQVAVAAFTALARSLRAPECAD